MKKILAGLALLAALAFGGVAQAFDEDRCSERWTERFAAYCEAEPTADPEPEPTPTPRFGR